MPGPVLRSLLVALACLLLASAGAAAAAPDSSRCVKTRSARDRPLVLPDGTRLTVHDPYGGVLARTRRTFRFSVRGDDAGLAAANTVRWYLDDHRVAFAVGAPFEWRGRTSALRIGHHTLTVQAFPSDGVFATTSFSLRVVRCGS